MPESPLVFERQILAEQDNLTAVQLLAQGCPEISKQKLKLAMKYGAVWFADPSGKIKPQRLRRAKRIMPKGSKLFIYYNQQVLLESVEPAQLISDQGSYSIWNKPSGMFSQGTKWADHTSIGRWIELFGVERESLANRETYLVHRLDRATNGVIVVAHTKPMVKTLTALFEVRGVNKQYSAVVDGQFPIDKLTKFDLPIDGRRALTKILSADYCPRTQQSILRLGLETGRKHQIRKHLAGAGFPVKNDYLYGNSDLFRDKYNRQGEPKAVNKNLLLRSCLIEFSCPESNQKVRFEIPEYDTKSLNAD
jgi:23S rRNA pseudouridine955/2504/2580 synthase